MFGGEPVFLKKNSLVYLGRDLAPLLLPPNWSEFIVNCTPTAAQREEHAPPPLPAGAYCLLTTWKCPRGGLSARRRAGWKSGCAGTSDILGSGAKAAAVWRAIDPPLTG